MQRIWKSLLLLTCAVLLAAIWWGTRTDITIHPEAEEITFEAGSDWSYLCLSGAYEITDLELDQLGKAQNCWGGEEVPQGRVFMTYVRQDGSCMRHVIQGQLLSDDGHETRCYPRAELQGRRLVNRSGVYVFTDE